MKRREDVLEHMVRDHHVCDPVVQIPTLANDLETTTPRLGRRWRLRLPDAPRAATLVALKRQLKVKLPDRARLKDSYVP